MKIKLASLYLPRSRDPAKLKNVEGKWHLIFDPQQNDKNNSWFRCCGFISAAEESPENRLAGVAADGQLRTIDARVTEGRKGD
ncbi:MAG: hypothetical protein AAF597_09720 [Bacteroidota bacterium]